MVVFLQDGPLRGELVPLSGPLLSPLMVGRRHRVKVTMLSGRRLSQTVKEEHSYAVPGESQRNVYEADGFHSLGCACRSRRPPLEISER